MISVRKVAASASFSRVGFVLSILLIWLVAAAALVALRWNAIVMQDFIGTDDQMRLMQVRDWLAGQGFQDVTQYRMNPPEGAPMHWSRLVDLPLGGMILPLRPLLGQAQAEIATAVTVPLITLGVIMVLAGYIGRRLAGPAAGILSAIYCAVSVPLLLQTMPLRVDHHGWITAFSTLALLGVLDRNGRRSGMATGIAIAIALHISLEALPLVLMLGGALGLHWMMKGRGEAGRRLAAFALSLLICEAALTVIFRRPMDWLTAYCDSVTYPQLLALCIMAAGAALLVRIQPARWVIRAAGLAGTMILAMSVYHLIPPYCGVDAFSQLEPNVRSLWYETLLEGRPVWTLSPDLVLLNIGFPVLGVLCAIAGWWCAPVQEKPFWRTYAILTVALLTVAILVQRTSGLASVAAAPAAAWAVIAVARRFGGGISLLPLRVVGATLLLFAFSPLALISAYASFASAEAAPPQFAVPGQRPCSATEYIKGLRLLPPSRVLAPLDYGPSLLLNTAHQPVASNHHRNHVAMSEVITAFTADSRTAHAIVAKRGIRFVMLCPCDEEILRYIRYSPDGLAAMLSNGRTPGWLVPRPIRSNPIKLWEVAP